MAFELNEAGITFIVGAFTILAVETVAWVFLGKHLTGFFRGRLGLADSGAVTAGVFFGFSFALGLLMEDVTYKYSDPFIYPPLRAANAVLRGNDAFADPKSELQIGALVKTFRDCRPTPTPLGQSLTDLELFSAVSERHGAAVEHWLSGGSLPPPSVVGERYSGLSDGVAALFYFCKNRVFASANYYDELRRLHSRLEFSQTILLAAVLQRLLLRTDDKMRCRPNRLAPTVRCRAA